MRLGKPVVVDPKGTDFSVYRGATVITPNRKELAEASRMPVGTEREVAAAAAAIREAVGAQAVLVTLSEEGMLLACCGRRAGARPGLSGAGARRVGRRRYGCRGARRPARDRSRFRGGDPGGQCRGLGRRRQARHRDGDGRRAARAHPRRRRRSPPRRRSRSIRRSPSSGWASGAPPACASASPTAASTSSIPAMSTF